VFRMERSGIAMCPSTLFIPSVKSIEPTLSLGRSSATEKGEGKKDPESHSVIRLTKAGGLMVAVAVMVGAGGVRGVRGVREPERGQAPLELPGGDHQESEGRDGGRCLPGSGPATEGRGLAGGARGPEVQQGPVRGVELGRLGADGAAGDRPKLAGVRLRGRVDLPGLPEPST
jgi:hypothetical protein